MIDKDFLDSINIIVSQHNRFVERIEEIINQDLNICKINVHAMIDTMYYNVSDISKCNIGNKSYINNYILSKKLLANTRFENYAQNKKGLSTKETYNMLSDINDKIYDRFIDIVTGTIKITPNLVINDKFTLDDFKKTPFYKGVDSDLVKLEGKYKLNHYNYIITLVFKTNKISVVSLVCCDYNFNEKNEKQRQKLHTTILNNMGLFDKNSFKWGQLRSEYNPFSSTSEIIVDYNATDII